MGRAAIDLTGLRYGNLVVMRRAGTSTSGQAMWRCACDCGGAHTVLGQSLRSGASTRCPACVTSGRGLTEQPRTDVDFYYHAAGEQGGFVVARDHLTGDILAHSAWSRTPVRGAPNAYPLIKGVIKALAQAGRIPPKGSDESYDRWARRANLNVRTHAFQPRPQLQQLWAELEASGKGIAPARPEADTSPRFA